MAKFTNDTIKEYRQIMREDYRVNLSESQASEQLSKLVNFFECLSKMVYKEKTLNKL